MPRLDLIGVSKTYGDIQALVDVSLRVEDKEYVCILGPSGCGKSTLIRCIAGINEPEKGQILIDGKHMEKASIEDRQIGYVFQDIALFPHMSVRDNLSYGLSVRHAPSKQTVTVTNEMLDLINMRSRSKSYPRELSGGAQQKVAVGRAIATGSRLFLLDEPLGALDALVRAELRYELRKLASDLGLTVIHVTHDQEEALSIADRVVIMKNGRIVEVGKPTEIYLSPRTLFAENFVGETNLLEGIVSAVNGADCAVIIAGRKIVAPACGHKIIGQRVILSIRPEFVPVGLPTPNRWSGQVKQVTFFGNLNRYVIELEGGVDVISEESTAEYGTGFRVGENVSVLLEESVHMLLFDYPAEGLEKEISLE
ncbi:MAG TPA: ABC transporter ATP-binding protein [Candidatus Acidoferrales bacterium]|nr:ABC transporter ATP-binding protein [Candidatus Acidoferrales bacterium]